MKSGQYEYCYQQIHIDAARNATDDSNPFHDQKKWNRIRGNPFGMPIVLAFQVEALIEYLVALFEPACDHPETLAVGKGLGKIGFPQ